MLEDPVCDSLDGKLIILLQTNPPESRQGGPISFRTHALTVIDQLLAKRDCHIEFLAFEQQIDLVNFQSKYRRAVELASRSVTGDYHVHHRFDYVLAGAL